MFDLVTLGLVLIFAGFAVIVVAVILSAKPSSTEKETKVRGGGVVMIGPIPLIFGSDMKWATVAIVLAIALIALTLLLNLNVI